MHQRRIYCLLVIRSTWSSALLKPKEWRPKNRSKNFNRDSDRFLWVWGLFYTHITLKPLCCTWICWIDEVCSVTKPILFQEYCITFSQKDKKNTDPSVHHCVWQCGLFYLHYILLCLTCNRTLHLLQHCQEMKEGVIRAQQHNRQLLQQFKEAQGTLREMLTLTAAMKTTRVKTVTDTWGTKSECKNKKKDWEIGGGIFLAYGLLNKL